MRASTRRVARELLGVLGVRDVDRLLRFNACVGLAVLAYVGAHWLPGLTPQARQVTLILVLAAGLWTTEAVPAFAVSTLIMALGVALLGRPGRPPGDTPWQDYVTVLGHPLIWLFFGSFALAAGIAKVGLDQRLAAAMLRFCRGRARRVRIGTVALTFAFSMFMSNTATAAMMTAMLAPLFARAETPPAFTRAMLVGVALAANLGGMSTLIGSPPNAIAVGLLDVSGASAPTFLGWMRLGLPPALALMAAGWWWMSRCYAHEDFEVVLPEPSVSRQAPPWQSFAVLCTFALTVGLWMTGSWHRIPTAAVSFLPIVTLTVSGVLKRDDIRSLSWDILLLIAGGLALGLMVTESGLAAWVASRIPVGQDAVLLLMLLLGALCVLMSNFMSNTAAANVLIPLAVALRPEAASPLALTVALCASTAMCLPVSTPPNAIAFAQGSLRNQDLLRVGLLLGALGPVVVSLWTWLLS